MVFAPTGEPQIDGVAQSVDIDAGTAIDRAQEGYRPVGRRPTVIAGKPDETVLHVASRDGIEWAHAPVVEVVGELGAVHPVGARRPLWIDRHVVLEGLHEQRHGARLGALDRRVVPACGLAERLMGQPPRLIDGHPAETAEDDALVGRLSAAAAGAVVDEEGLGAGGVDLDAKAGELVVPGGPWLVAWGHGLDGAPGEGELVACDAFGGFVHGGILGDGTVCVNTFPNTRNPTRGMPR